MPELRIENLSKTYGARRVLRDLNLTASGGEVVGIIGPNGSGKSTLLKIVAGLLRPSNGTVRLTADGRTAQEAEERRRLVGYAGPDVAFYPELSARENLQFFATVRGQAGAGPRIAELLRQVGLGRREDDPVSAYSSGMKQRLRLVFALLADPAVLLLDEPSLALDTDGVSLVEQTIASYRAEGRLVLLATNDPKEREWADRLIFAGEMAVRGGARVLDA